jgi:hypothetical protein
MATRSRTISDLYLEHQELLSLSGQRERSWREYVAMEDQKEHTFDVALAVFDEAISTSARGLEELEYKLELIADWFAGDDLSLRFALGSLISDVKRLQLTRGYAAPDQAHDREVIV